MKKLFTKFHLNLNNKSILITGGTGSFVSILSKVIPNINRND